MSSRGRQRRRIFHRHETSTRSRVIITRERLFGECSSLVELVDPPVLSKSGCSWSRRRSSTTSSWVHQCQRCSAATVRLRCSSATWRCSVACSALTTDSRSSTLGAYSRRPERLSAAPARRSRAACTTAPPTSSAARDVAPPPRRLTCGQMRERITLGSDAIIRKKEKERKRKRERKRSIKNYDASRRGSVPRDNPYSS